MGDKNEYDWKGTDLKTGNVGWNPRTWGNIVSNPVIWTVREGSRTAEDIWDMNTDNPDNTPKAPKAPKKNTNSSRPPVAQTSAADFRMWEEYYDSREKAQREQEQRENIPPIVVPTAPVDPWQAIQDEYMNGVEELLGKVGTYETSPEDKQALENAKAALQQQISQGVTNVGGAYDQGSQQVRDVAGRLVQQGKQSGVAMGDLFKDAANSITASNNAIGVQGLDQYGGIGGVTVPTGEAQSMADLLMSYAPIEQSLVTNLGQIYGADQQAYANSMLQQKANDLSWLQERGQSLQQQMANEYLKREADKRASFELSRQDLQSKLMAEALKSEMDVKMGIQEEKSRAEAYDEWAAASGKTTKPSYVPSNMEERFNNLDTEINSPVSGSEGTTVPASVIQNALMEGLLTASQYDDPNQKRLMYSKAIQEALGNDVTAFENIKSSYPSWSPDKVFGTYKSSNASTTTTTKTASSKTTSTKG
jgi:hypothetical protein